ncbi:Aminotransferase class-V [Musa troglodytarum]|uniref:Aminotransferase class-V n=1 Tax=Musa troglodytarum TaxID=320322 RepID=A0A9E7FAT2_9LILI|nr:Aminotransferase class-V [Musa troglodytarum]
MGLEQGGDSNRHGNRGTNHELLGLLRMTSERSSSSDERIAWLQSQLIGHDVVFDTPFGQRLLIYADHTASGRSLRYIENYILQYVLPVYGNTHTDDSFVGSETTRMVHEAADYIKRCMGGGDEDALMFCGSGSSAAIKRLQEVIGIAVSSTMRERIVASLSDEERWVVFVGPYEHHSNLLSWRQTTAEVVEIGMDENGLLDMEALRLHLTSSKYADRPMLGSFSACSNVTGILADTRSLARLLHGHGAFACFDFAASGPYVDIDMRSGDMEGYDAVFLSPHKFVGGPGTAGILLMNKALYQLKTSPPSTSGGGTVAYVNGFDEKDTLYHADIEEREDSGTPPIIQKIRAALAFWVKEYIGHDLIALRGQLYAETALARLLSNPNIAVLGNTTVQRLPIFSFLVFPSSQGRKTEEGKPLHGRFVAKLLNDLFGIQARGGCACAGPYGHHLLGVDMDLSLRFRSAIHEGYNGLKPGWTRVSFTYYTSEEESAYVLAAIEFVAAHGHRFLPLYNFDWGTGDWTFRKRAFKHHRMKEELEDLSRCLLGDATTGAKKKRTPCPKPGREGSGSAKMKRLESYLEGARRIALSLPERTGHGSAPEEIDPNLITFTI